MKDGKDKNVLSMSAAEYPSNSKRWLNDTILTLWAQKATDDDSSSVAGSFENGYDESLTTIKGRVWYVGLNKTF